MKKAVGYCVLLLALPFVLLGMLACVVFASVAAGWAVMSEDLIPAWRKALSGGEDLPEQPKPNPNPTIRQRADRYPWNN